MARTRRTGAVQPRRKQPRIRTLDQIEKTSAGRAHRRKYRYQARWHGTLVVRYEREPIRHPEMPDHKHNADGTRERCDPVTPKDVVEDMWREVERRKRLREQPAASTEADVA